MDLAAARARKNVATTTKLKNKLSQASRSMRLPIMSTMRGVAIITIITTTTTITGLDQSATILTKICTINSRSMFMGQTATTIIVTSISK